MRSNGISNGYGVISNSYGVISNGYGVIHYSYGVIIYKGVPPLMLCAVTVL